MNFSYDDFIRTSEKRHIKACQHLWKCLEDAGQIYLGAYSGWYAIRDEAFYSESELKQDKEGNYFAPSGAKAEWLEEPSYFFKLSSWQDKLLEFYNSNPNFIQPISRRNEVLSFVKGGLQDLSISRTSFKWGISIPEQNNHIMYVWLDALTNYITALGYPNKFNEYDKFWPADLHLVGKDILRFHAVYWPAFLMAAGLLPPKRIFAHGWWTNEGNKISKSLGNVIDPLDLVKKYGLDQLRYFLLREVPFGNDGDFSHTAIINRVNSDLSNDYGNLVQRVMSMIYKNCSGKVPCPEALNKDDNAIIELVYGLPCKLREKIENLAFNQALEDIWFIIRKANSYVDAQAPWMLRKEDPGRMATVLYVLAEIIRNLAIATQPFMPSASEKILKQLSADTGQITFKSFGKDHALKAGLILPKPEGVFPRLTND